MVIQIFIRQRVAKLSEHYFFKIFGKPCGPERGGPAGAVKKR